MLRNITPDTFITAREHVAYGIHAKPAGEERIPAGAALRLVGSSVVVQTVILLDDGDRVVGILADELEADLEAQAADVEAAAQRLEAAGQPGAALQLRHATQARA